MLRRWHEVTEKREEQQQKWDHQLYIHG